MSSNASVKLIGVPNMRNALKSLAKRFPDDVATAMFQEAQVEMTEAKRRTPVEFGNLRASGTVLRPERKGRDVVVPMVFGGVAAPYAIYVHENLDAHHDVGQAKFLESVLRESAPFIAARVAKRVKEMEGR